jgi:hypothetical protein
MKDTTIQPRTKTEFLAEFTRIRRTIGQRTTKDYGENVLPFMKLYSSLPEPERRRNFQDALEELLGAEDADTRHFATTVCLGFFVLRDCI